MSSLLENSKKGKKKKNSHGAYDEPRTPMGLRLHQVCNAEIFCGNPSMSSGGSSSGPSCLADGWLWVKKIKLILIRRVGSTMTRSKVVKWEYPEVHRR